jgi:hypothetical protein
MTDIRHHINDQHRTTCDPATRPRRTRAVRRRILASAAALGLTLTAGSAAFADGGTGQAMTGADGHAGATTGTSTVSADAGATAKTPKLGDRDSAYYFSTTEITRHHSKLSKKQLEDAAVEAVDGGRADCEGGIKPGKSTSCDITTIDEDGESTHQGVDVTIVKSPSKTHSLILREAEDNAGTMVGTKPGTYLAAGVRGRDASRPSALEDALEEQVLGTQIDEGDDGTADLKASCAHVGHDSEKVRCTLKGSDPEDGVGTWYGKSYEGIFGNDQYLFVKAAS